jgi:signal transduction histidine kinase
MIEVQASESGIATRLEQTGDVPPVMADKEALRSVFTNLLLNGLQAIDGSGGELVVSISAQEGNRVRVDISDTGRGIDADDISKVFEPYYSTKETGTGLGLAIVKKAVDDHGGTVSVSSKPGTGTTFTITLPTSGKDEG